ncbi:MAG: ribosomal protein S18-alanine N-acetyltransferase [Methylovirgula sp.]
MFGFFDTRRRPPDIRRIGPQVAAACAKIHTQSFAYPWSAADFETLLAARDVIGEAAMAATRWGKSAELAGFILSRRVLEEAEILTIAVAPEFRRKGIGSALLGVHLATLAAQGIKVLFLEVEAGNQAALALYAQFGFQQVGERQAYYRKADGPPTAALVLRRDFG